MHTHPVIIGYESNESIILEQVCIDGINKLQDPDNPIMVYSLNHDESIPALLLVDFIIIDQIERRMSTNHELKIVILEQGTVGVVIINI